MAIGRLEETALIQALYTAASRSGGGDWSGFLDLLARETRAESALLFLREFDQKTVSVSGEIHELLPNALLSHADPAGMKRMRVGRVYSRDDLPGVMPESVAFFRILRVRLKEVNGWLLLTRNWADFRALDSSLLSSLSPHLVTGLQIWADLGRNSLDFVTSHHISRRFQTEWIAFDANARVIEASNPKTAMAERLLLADPDIAAGFSKAFRDVLRSGTSQAVYLGDDLGQEIMLQRFAPENRFSTRHNAIAVLGYVRTFESGSTNPDLIAESLQIARSEARLAAALAQGYSIAEAAGKLGLTIETARNYTRQIYAKTGLKGQADLVRRILQGVSML